MRQIVLDTETTGLSVEDGHRIIEIGCVEIVDRRLTGSTLHLYLDPGRDIDEGAFAVHGLSRERLAGEPRFADIAAQFLDFVRGAELLIHNAPFDEGFLDAELRQIDHAPLRGVVAGVVDTLALARETFPGRRNSLDALCERIGISNVHRKLHGALLDAELLAHVYLAMTRGQETLGISLAPVDLAGGEDGGAGDWPPANLSVLAATGEELRAHHELLADIGREAGRPPVWESLAPG